MRDGGAALTEGDAPPEREAIGDTKEGIDGICSKAGDLAGGGDRSWDGRCPSSTEDGCGIGCCLSFRKNNAAVVVFGGLCGGLFGGLFGGV